MKLSGIIYTLLMISVASEAFANRLPTVRTQPLLQIPHKDHGKAGLSERIVAFASEGMSSLDAANNLCAQIANIPQAPELRMSDFLTECPQMLCESFDRERGVASMLGHR